MGAAAGHGAALPLAAALDRGTLLSLSTALFYGTSSVLLIFLNKWAFILFLLTNIVLLLQLLLTLGVLAAQRRAAPAAATPAWCAATARAAAPLSALYLGNVVFSLLSLKGLNLPMYLVLRRNTPLVIILLKRVLRGSWPTPQVFASVLVVCGGSLVAGYNDLDAELASYLCAAASCFLQAGYMLAIEVRSKGHQHPPPAGGGGGGGSGAVGNAAPPAVLSEGEMLHYNSLLNLPFVVAICAATGELSGARAAAAAAVAKASGFELFLALGGCAGGGMVLNYAMMLCTSTNSALTTTIVGVLKGVVGTIAGFFVLGGAKLTHYGVLGVTLNTAGGCLYSYYKWREKVDARAAAAAGKEDAESGGGGGGPGRRR
ncbi:MAG: hypothetical protein J3K34DRAFT_381086 [Monoraphidium minutum]|nr:MAG: hypothetical protein J3K34DRAFT_381086 [Monoraphidium minutum]